jgi:hypothetical protein
MVLSFGACLLAASSASAQTDLPDGGAVTPSTGTASSILGTGYTVLSTQNFTGVGNGSITEDLATAVVKTAGGTYDFLYQVTNHSGGGVTIDGLNVADYSQFTTGVADLTDGSTVSSVFSNGTVPATTASKPSPFSTVIFGFGTNGSGDLNNGDVSQVLVVATNATNYNELGTATATTLTINGGAYSQNLVIEPIVPSVTPEPGSLVLAGLGLVSVAGAYGFRRRRGR